MSVSLGVASRFMPYAMGVWAGEMMVFYNIEEPGSELNPSTRKGEENKTREETQGCAQRERATERVSFARLAATWWVALAGWLGWFMPPSIDHFCCGTMCQFPTPPPPFSLLTTAHHT